MMGFLGEGGNAAMRWIDGRYTFPFVSLFGHQTAPVVFFLEFLSFFRGYDFYFGGTG